MPGGGRAYDRAGHDGLGGIAVNEATLVSRRATVADEEQILALARRSLGWGDDARFAALYRWKHDENVFGSSPRWVTLDGERVVGFRSLMRWQFRSEDGATKLAVRAVDTATDPDYQGRGIFRSLTMAAVEGLTADGIDFVFNSPNDQSRPGYLKMGWVELGRPPVAIVPRLGSLLRVAKARTAADRWSLPTDLGTPAPEFFATADARWAALWTPAPGHWTVDRSLPWCRWRYGLDSLNYRVLTTDDLPRPPKEPGAIVFRLRRRGAAVEATVAQVAAAPAARRRLLRALLRDADYALVAATRTVDPTPAVAVSAFSPLLTWRDLAFRGPVPLSAFRFELGDLELF